LLFLPLGLFLYACSLASFEYQRQDYSFLEKQAQDKKNLLLLVQDDLQESGLGVGTDIEIQLCPPVGNLLAEFDSSKLTDLEEERDRWREASDKKNTTMVKKVCEG
jgi:hypothetical protein